MLKAKNSIWRFFASARLALIIMISLAVTSIIGTVIKQGQDSSYYIQEYGPNLARLLEATNITDMYGSWWFVALLSLFAVNLLVCSIERLPGVWRLVTQDNLGIDPSQVAKMSCTHETETGLAPAAAAERMQRLMSRAGWKNPGRSEREGSIILFSQAGAWTRLGVYIVHLSILVILAGVLIGTFFGCKAYVFLPEGRTTGNVFLRKNQEPLPLGFDLRNDRYSRSFYTDGTVREYRADLTVFDPARQTPYRKSIIVNDPLTYRGLTFYLADSYPLEEYSVVIRCLEDGAEQAFRVPSDLDVAWPAKNVSFRIEELRRDPKGEVRQAKIRFAGEDPASSSVFWVADNDRAVAGRQGENFAISFRQLRSALLLVKKDPGVSTMFFGCGLLVVGLAISFFLSHRRLWVLVAPKGRQGSRILVAGSANKNKPAFEGLFQRLVSQIGENEWDACAGRRRPLISARSR